MEKLKSIRQSNGGVRGSVKSLVGRGDDGFAQARGRAEAHNSTPLSALKDPSSFAPPPKHSAVYPSSEGSTETGQPTTASPASLARPLPARPAGGRVIADQEAAEAKTSSNGPFRIDTTGLSTAHLPKPPVKRNGSLNSTTQDQPVNTNPVATARIKKPGPPLPPRLPPRSAVASAVPSSPPPPYSSPITSMPSILSTAQAPQNNGNLLNQDAIKRLGNAGVSVPGFDIVPNRDPSSGARVNQTATASTESQKQLANLASAASAHAGTANSLGVLSGKQPVALPPKPVLPSFVKNAQASSHNEKPGPPPIPLSTKPR